MRKLLPPISRFHEPFIEPLGHLAIQAAFADERMIELLSVIPFKGSTEQMSECDVAGKIRNWSDEFAENRLNLIRDVDFRDVLSEIITRYRDLKLKRNRAIHDAIHVHACESDSGLIAKTKALEFKHSKGQTKIHVNDISPSDIIKLCSDFYYLNNDLNIWIDEVENSSP